MNIKWVLLGAGLLALPGCYGSPDITYHRPHEYKGKTDPLLALERSPAQQETLAKRFRLVQTDR